MFSTEKEEKVTEIYENQCIVPVRSMIANSILSGCRIASKINEDPSNLSLPKSAYYNTAYTMGFIANKILVRLIDDDNFSGVLYSEPKHGHGRPCIQYQSNGITFQLKKETSVKKLPPRANYRVKQSAQNQTVLDLGAEYGPIPLYMLVTYNHKRFKLDYVQIGVPKEDYSDWLQRWSLMQYIQEEQVEYIIKNYSTELKEEYQEDINKKYKISLK